MKKLTKLLALPFLMISLLMVACGTMSVAGRTFVYDSVSIDWGTANDEAKNSLYEEYQVSSESELLGVLKTRNNRDKRITAFGTNGQYTTKNTDGEVLDEGYFKQDESVITLADTEDGLKEDGAYTLQANEKGYIVTIKLNDENKIFAKYKYVEKK